MGRFRRNKQASTPHLTERLTLAPHACPGCGTAYKLRIEYHMMKSRVLNGRSENTVWECPQCAIPVMFVGRCGACQTVHAALVERREDAEHICACPACGEPLSVHETRFAHP